MDDDDYNDNDDSSTGSEIDRLKEKLVAIEANARKLLESQKPPTRIFQCSSGDEESDPSSSDDESYTGNRVVDDARNDSLDRSKTVALSSQHVAPRAMMHAEESLPPPPSVKAPSSSQESSHQASLHQDYWIPDDDESLSLSPMPHPPSTPPPAAANPIVNQSMMESRKSKAMAKSTSVEGDNDSTTTSSSSSSSSSSPSSTSTSSDDSSSSSSTSEERSEGVKTQEQLDIAASQSPTASVVVCSQTKTLVNPYTSTTTRKQPKPVGDNKRHATAVCPRKQQSPLPPPLTPDSKPLKQDSCSPQEDAAALKSMEEYLLFFESDNEDLDSEMQQQEVKSPHFAAAASAANTGPSSIAEQQPSPIENDSMRDDTAKIPLPASTAAEAPPVTMPQNKGRPPEAPGRPVQEVMPPGSDLPGAEIEPSLFAPPPFQPKRQAILHKFHEGNRPIPKRRHIPISDLFQPHLTTLWRANFEHFNAVQSELADRLCNSNDHVVVSAPTGAGKTVIFEMAMAKFIEIDLMAQPGVAHGVKRLSPHRKMVYMAPSKALCEERLQDWTRRLALLNLGIQVSMITGDSIDPGAWFHDLSDAHLILTTPEKWDSITRKWTENFFLLATVKLLMVDEVHLLGDDSRGHCLEAIIARMKSIQRAALNVNATQERINSSSYSQTTPAAIASSMRTVAVSATLPNIVDVADFVGASEAFAFDGSFRPVPLAKHVVSVGYVGNNEFKFWNSLDNQVPPLINRFSGGKQTLIFCHTKGETERLCQTLITNNFGKAVNTHAPPGTVDHCLAKGVAYHHGGLPPEDKNRIEKAFLAGNISCLCATSTLAVGVNLPARLVIVKGTRTWRGGGNGYTDIDKSSILQMIGRAGRPGLDTSGIAVIMTDSKSKSMVEHQIQGLGPAESRILPKLVDILNTEISQRVISDMDSAMRWLKTTFLFGRIMQEPAKYAMDRSWRSVEDYLENLVERGIRDLVDAGLVHVSQGGAIQPLPASHVMSYAMVPFDSMKLIASLPFDANKCQILKAISKMEAFSTHVRRNEKKALNDCHKDERIRFKLNEKPSKVRIQEPWEKAFVLLQAFVGQYAFDSKNFGLAQQMTTAGSNAQRILLAAQEFSLKGSRHGYVALMCLKLRRSFHFSLWEQGSAILNQLDWVGYQTATNLQQRGIASFEQVLEYSEDELERSGNEKHLFGKKLRSAVSDVLKSKLKISANVTFTRGSDIAADVFCNLSLADPAAAVISGTNKVGAAYTLVRKMQAIRTQYNQMKTISFSVQIAFTDQPGTCLLFREGITGPVSYRFSPPPKFGKLFIHLVGPLIGLDETIVLDGNDKVLPSAFVDRPKGQNRLVGGKKSSVHDPRLKKNGKGMHQGNVLNMLREQRAREEDKRKTAVDESATRESSALSSVPLPPSNPVSTQPSVVPATARSQPSSSLDPVQRHTGSMQPIPRASGTSLIPIGNQSNSIPNLFSAQRSTPLAPCISYIGGIQRRPEEPNENHPPAGYSEADRSRSPLSQNMPPWMGHNPPSTRGSLPVPRVATITPASAAPRRPSQSPMAPSSGPVRHTPNSRKRVAPNAWAASRKRQQRTQQRAFASRSDNPFAFFQHDPNDAESLLDDLSQRNHEAHSIIPDEELQKFPTGDSRRWGFARSKTTRPRNNRRQGFGHGERLSVRDALRMKADEASAYTMNSISPMQAMPYSNQAMTAEHHGRECGVPAASQRYPSSWNSNFTPQMLGSQCHYADGQYYHGGAEDLSDEAFAIAPSMMDPSYCSSDAMQRDESIMYQDNLNYSVESIPHQYEGWTPELQQSSQYDFFSRDMTQDGTFGGYNNDWPEQTYLYPPDQRRVGIQGRPLPQEEAFLPQGFF